MSGRSTASAGAAWSATPGSGSRDRSIRLRSGKPPPPAAPPGGGSAEAPRSTESADPRSSFNRKWAEDRGGTPATVEDTEHGDHLGVLRLDFGGGGDRLRQVSWEEWFATFDARRLNFIYLEERTDGRQSNFFRWRAQTEKTRDPFPYRRAAPRRVRR